MLLFVGNYIYSHFDIMQLWNSYDDDGKSVIVRVGSELAECTDVFLYTYLRLVRLFEG